MYTIELAGSLLKKPDQLHAKLDGQTIRIVDRVNDEESVEIKASLKDAFSRYVADKTLIWNRDVFFFSNPMQGSSFTGHL